MFCVHDITVGAQFAVEGVETGPIRVNDRVPIGPLPFSDEPRRGSGLGYQDLRRPREPDCECEMICYFSFARAIFNLSLIRLLGINKVHELAEKLSPSQIQALFQDALHWLEAELDFPRPERWVETENNVRFKVLERNLALTVAAIKSHFTTGPSLYELLERLVDERNAIAHGASFSPVTAELWSELREFVEKLLNALQLYLYESLLQESSIFDSVAAVAASRAFPVGSYAYSSTQS